MRILFTILLVWLLVPAIHGQASSAARTWQVQKYDLVVNLPADEKSRQIDVQATIDLKNVSDAPAGGLTLRISSSAEVSAVKINGASVEPTKSVEKISAASSLQRIATKFAPVVPNGPLTVAVTYKLDVKDNSAVASLSAVSTQFLPLSFWYPTANSWFFTQGGDSAPFSLKVSTLPAQNTISSGNYVAGAIEQKLNGQPFFLAGSWDVLDQNGVFVFFPKGTGSGQMRASELAGLMSEAKTFMAGLLGKAPDVPMKIVSSRCGAGFSGGGTVIVDEAVFRRSKIDSQTAMNIAEAAAKLWIGDQAFVTGEGYGVIGEGLTRYLATQFIENKFGKDVADVERLRQRSSYTAISKRDAALGKASPLDDYYYAAVANKGAMVWRLLARRVGQSEFSKVLQASMQDGNLNLAELRAAFSAEKETLDYLLDQVTNMDLMAGLPQPAGAETKVALRNTGAIDASVDVTATTESGQKITASVTIKATDFGEVGFKSPSKVVSVEVDPEKLYPQSEYSDDIAPQRFTDSDPLLTIKRFFDKQDFAGAETAAQKLLGDLPRCDEVRTLLARSLLAQNKNSEAEKEFRAILNEKLPVARSVAWANVGLGEIASRSNQKDAAIKYAEAVIDSDADYGASLAARVIRNKLGSASAGDPAVKTFFSDFDKAAASKRKADLVAMTVLGEVTKFVGGAAGSAETWQTQITQIDRLDPNTILVEANMNVKLLGSNESSGSAVYRLVKIGNAWKLLSVDMFEVR